MHAHKAWESRNLFWRIWAQQSCVHRKVGKQILTPAPLCGASTNGWPFHGAKARTGRSICWTLVGSWNTTQMQTNSDCEFDHKMDKHEWDLWCHNSGQSECPKRLLLATVRPQFWKEFFKLLHHDPCTVVADTCSVDGQGWLTNTDNRSAAKWLLLLLLTQAFTMNIAMLLAVAAASCCCCWLQQHQIEVDRSRCSSARNLVREMMVEIVAG